MRTIEEQIWDYIDGTCTASQRAETEAMIASDKVYASTYKELLKVQEQINGLELEEPSMSFSRNVMEQINREIKPVALSTKVDKRIIYSIAAFFVISILSVFFYAASRSTFKLPELEIVADIERYVNPATLKIILFVDVALALVYLDGLMRRRLDKAR